MPLPNLSNVASRVAVLKFREELEKRRQEAATRPKPVPVPEPGRTEAELRLRARMPQLGVPNPLEALRGAAGGVGGLLNRAFPRRSMYDFSPMAQPFAAGTAPVQPQAGLPGQQVSNVGQTQLGKYMASPGMQTLAATQYSYTPESWQRLPYVGPGLRTAGSPMTWAFGPEIGAGFVGGGLLGGAGGRVVAGEEGEKWGAFGGELIGPGLPALGRYGGRRLAETVLPAARTEAERLYPAVREAAVAGEAGGLKLPGEKVAEAGRTAVRMLFGREKALSPADVKAWRTRLKAGIESEGVEVVTGSQQRALRGAAKVAARTEGDDVTRSALGKLVYWVRTYKPKIGEYKLAKHEELAQRAAKIDEIWARTDLTPGEKLFQARQVTTGELAPGTAKATVPLTDAEISALEEMIGTAELTSFEKPTTLEILRDLTSTGRKLTDGEIALLGKAYGLPFASEVFGAQRGIAARLTDEIYELYRIPMQIMSSGELSATLRQGALGIGRPRQMAQAFKTELAALGMPKVAEQRYLYWTKHPLIKTYGEKLQLTPIGKAAETASYAAREEQYLGHVGPAAKTTVARILNSIPGVGQVARISERTYIAFLNEITGARFVEHIQTWQRMGVKITPELADALSSWLNICRGRGPLGPLAKHIKLLTVPLWAPRLWAARLATVPQGVRLAIQQPEMRALIARDLASFIAANTGLLVALKQSGLADVELDFRSTDVVKIRIGPMRLDPWGGFQQTVRSLAQIATGQRKATGTGEVYDVKRLETALRTVGGKLHPAFGLGVDIARGETMMGEEVEPTMAGVKLQAWNRLVPLFWQDVVDAYKALGWKGAALASPGLLGVGVQTYETPFQKKWDAQNEIAKEKGYENFDAMADALGTPEATRITDADERVKALEPEIEKYKKTHGGMRSMSDIAKPFEEEQGEDDAKLEEGTLLPADWVDNLNDRAQNLSQRNTEYLAVNPEAAERFEKDKAGIDDPFNLPDDATPDTVRTAYYMLFDPYRGDTGVISADEWAKLGPDIDRFRASLTPEQEAALDENLGAGKSDKVKEYRADKKEMQPYFDLTDEEWQKFCKTVARAEPYADMTYEQYRQQRAAELRDEGKGEGWLERDPIVVLFERYSGPKRGIFLYRNPRIDALRTKWGHQKNVHSQKARDIYKEETGLEARVVKPST